MERYEIEEQLFAVAVERAAGAGRRLGEGADHDLRVMAANAATYLANITDEREQTRQFGQAKIDLIRLIDDAETDARNLPDYPDDLLGERTYFPARFRFCPCRPFC